MFTLWRLHTGLCKFVQNISRNIWSLGKRTDLNLGQVSCLPVSYNITISWPHPLNGFRFIFILRDSASQEYVDNYVLPGIQASLKFRLFCVAPQLGSRSAPCKFSPCPPSWKDHGKEVAIDQLVCCRASWAHNVLTTVLMRIVVDKGTHHAKPHSICYSDRNGEV